MVRAHFNKIKNAANFFGVKKRGKKDIKNLRNPTPKVTPHKLIHRLSPGKSQVSPRKGLLVHSFLKDIHYIQWLIHRKISIF